MQMNSQINANEGGQEGLLKWSGPAFLGAQHSGADLQGLLGFNLLSQESSGCKCYVPRVQF